MKRIEFHAMGSRMLAVLDNDSPEMESVLTRVPEWFETWEQVLSRFRPESELSQLNRSAGRPFSVSKTLWEVFHAARQAERFTGGMVSPTVLDALLQAGYDRSFELLPAIQTAPPDETHSLPDLSDVIAWDAPTRTLILPESVHLDLGGIAKGWAAQNAAKRLSRYGPALVDAGGDIALWGMRPDEQAWPIGINDPFQAGTHFETIKLKHGGVATSGKDYHRWLRDGNWQHHIIDPRTGLPAVTDVLAATVIAPTVLEAEAAAKTVLILGGQAGLDWLESDSGLAGILVLDNGDRLYSQQAESYLWRE
jgi:thiamine biosynthesis lipoprotein